MPLHGEGARGPGGRGVWAFGERDATGERQRRRTVMLELTDGIVAAEAFMQPSRQGKSSSSVHKTDTAVK